MAAARRLPIPARPVDRLLAAYAVLAGLALFFPHRPAAWPALAAAHLAMVAVGAGLVGSGPGRAHRTGLLRDAYPLLLVPFLYWELAALNVAVWNGRYFDPLIIGWEAALFGGQPSRAWAAAWPLLPLSELLHTAYLSYYVLILGPPLLIGWRVGREAFRHALFALMLTFVLHYLFFIWFPVQGPRYLFPPPGGPIAEGWAYALTHAVLEAGSSQGAAFPSSHVGVAVAQTLIVRRFLGRAWIAVAALALALSCGAVYGGFHYAIDALAGAGLGAFAVFAAPPIERALARTPRSASEPPP